MAVPAASVELAELTGLYARTHLCHFRMREKKHVHTIVMARLELKYACDKRRKKT